jgi:hypothetical protein
MLIDADCSRSIALRSSGMDETERLLLQLDGEAAEISEWTGKNFGLSGLIVRGW